MSRAALFDLHPSSYGAHRLHQGERDWVETNCYVDLWIEVLHALQLDPVPSLAFTLSVDFEGDQWTFFKPPPGDLRLLYGLEVQELNVWRSLPEHAVEQLRRGRLVVTEADAFFLPDAVGTAYRTQHAKTTIAIAEIDLAASQLGYFHNGGYHRLEGADYRGALRVDSGELPLYVEFVKLDGLRKPAPDDARQVAVSHYRRRPTRNPYRAFKDRFAQDLEWLRGGDLSSFHRYAFATLRQAGAAAQLASSYLRAAGGEMHSCGAAAKFAALSSAAKTLLLKTARTVSSGRTFDPSPVLAEMEGNWDDAMTRLGTALGA